MMLLKMTSPETCEKREREKEEQKGDRKRKKEEEGGDKLFSVRLS